MIIFPAIDIKGGKCVRLYKGDMNTASKVAEDPIETALAFKKAGASWLHTVDLDGACAGERINSKIFIEVAEKSGLKVEIGGGIRTFDDIDYYLSNGIERVILGSAALSSKQLVTDAVKKYGGRIAIGIDARNGKVAANGWTETSDTDYIELAKQMENVGVETLIFTDIDRDGTLEGPNIEQLVRLNEAVSCHVTASGGVSSYEDLRRISENGLYGAITGKAVYNGNIDLKTAFGYLNDDFFKKSELIPAVAVDYETDEVLMLAYMNRESLEKTFETGYTWYYSRSRQKLWNKGESSGHFQKVVSITGDCDSDTLLIKVIQQGPACHTGKHSCFFNEIY